MIFYNLISSYLVFIKYMIDKPNTYYARFEFDL